MIWSRTFDLLLTANSCFTDIKANIILIGYEYTPGGEIVKQAQLADIEDAALVPANCNIVGTTSRQYDVA
jgi:hypothetical protein